MLYKREKINNNFFAVKKYLRTPCAIDIKVIQKDHMAAIDKINFGWIEYSSIWSDDLNEHLQKMSIVKRECKDKFDINNSVQYAYIHTSESIEEFKSELERLKLTSKADRVICWCKDLAELYAFFKYEFDCETFYIDNTKLALLLVDNFLEIRDISVFTGNSLSDSLDYCKEPFLLSIPGHMNEKYKNKAIAYLLYFGDWYYKNTTGLPITIQQQVSNVLRKKMTIEDKTLIKSLYPDETAYKLLKKHAYIGAVITYNTDNNDVTGDVGHYDFVSSYSTRILLENFPISPMQKVSSLEEVECDETFLVEVEFDDLEALYDRRGATFLTTDCALSLSGEKVVDYLRVKNKIKSAKKARFLLCEVDYELVHKYYAFSNETILNVYKAKSGKLPEYVRAYTEECFTKKCETLGVERTYAKMQLEIIIGAMFKSIYKSRTTYWNEIVDGKILSPYWAIWTLAYARWEMLNMINLFGDDFICGHTDSCYFSNKSYYEPYIKQYNECMQGKIKNYCMYDAVTDFNYETVKSLGSFKDEDEDIKHIVVKNANSLVFINDYNEITTKIGGLPKHFVKKNKLVNVIEYNSTYKNIFANFMSYKKWPDYIDKYKDFDDEFDFELDGKRYIGKGYRYKWREVRVINEDLIAKEVQESIKLADELKNSIGFVK